MSTTRRHYKVGEIANLSERDVWNLPKGGLFVTFDNGEEIKCKTTAITISWYYWRLNLTNKAPILPTHFVGNGDYKSGVHTSLISVVLWDSYYMGKSQKRDMFWKLSKVAYENVTNGMYNTIIRRLDAMHSTVDLSDVMQIQLHPIVVNAKEDFAMGKIDEKEAHETIFTFIENDRDEFKDNQIAHMIRCDLADRRQLAQIIGPRANIADSNGEVFPHPIVGGYSDGMRSLYDMGIESRTASMSLYAQGANLEDSEYTNRQMQLLCSVIQTVDYRPCNGFKTMDWHVKSTDNVLLLGINYMDGKKVVRIAKDNFDGLVGKTLPLRVIHGCGNGRPEAPCCHCVGQNAISLPPGANLGHHLIVETLGALSQLMLSFKHVIANALVSYLKLSETDAKYVRLGAGNKKDHVYLRPTKQTGWRLQFMKSEIPQLSMIKNVDLGKLAIERVSALTAVSIYRYDKATNTPVNGVMIPTRIAGRGSPLSMEMLVYLREHGWTNDNDVIEVDLDGWDYKQPIIKTLPRGRDVTQTLNNFNSFVGTPAKGSEHQTKITEFTSVEAAIQFLTGILEATLKVNLVTVQVFIRALMAEIDSYHIPTNDMDFRFVSAKDAIKKRNLGGALAYQGQPELILNPGTYLGDTRDKLMPSPLDMMWA